MQQVMVVASSEEACNQLQGLLQGAQIQTDCKCWSGQDAREQLQNQSFQLVVINAPLSDEYGDEIAKLAYSYHADVIMLVKQEHADKVREKLQDTGVLMLPKPLKKSVFHQAVQCILWHELHMRKLQEEQDKLSEKIRDTNLINRAKILLIQVLRMTEPQAHRYIEKQAMDLRITRREVAEGIINTYEN